MYSILFQRQYHRNKASTMKTRTNPPAMPPMIVAMCGVKFGEEIELEAAEEAAGGCEYGEVMDTGGLDTDSEDSELGGPVFGCGESETSIGGLSGAPTMR